MMDDYETMIRDNNELKRVIMDLQQEIEKLKSVCRLKDEQIYEWQR